MAQRTLTSNTVVYLHGDHIGSTLILSRDNGTYSGQWYTPWGDRRNGQQLTETSREYTGQKCDETGLLFYNARYYDPVLARFVLLTRSCRERVQAAVERRRRWGVAPAACS